MNIAALVVWYYPQRLPNNTAVNNVLSYSKYFEKVIIIDNSENDNSALAFRIDNAEYYPNYENCGIAKALNIGCKKIYHDKYSMVMTMDQDSFWDDDQISEYLKRVDELSCDSTIVSFSPSINSLNKKFSFLGEIKHAMKKLTGNSERILRRQNDIQYADRVITSGNIINLDGWKKAGKFCEPLFINEVDYEICYKFINLGYKIIKINTCRMNHVEGEPKKTIFPHSFWYHKERIYYLTRNKYYIIFYYPDFAKKYGYRKDILRILTEKLKYFEFNDLRYAIKGILDAKRNIFGRLV